MKPGGRFGEHRHPTDAARQTVRGARRAPRKVPARAARLRPTPPPGRPFQSPSEALKHPAPARATPPYIQFQKPLSFPSTGSLCASLFSPPLPCSALPCPPLRLPLYDTKPLAAASRQPSSAPHTHGGQLGGQCTSHYP